MAFSEKFRWAWFVCSLLFVGFLANSISGYWVSRDRVRHTITESSLPLTSDNVYSEIQRDLLQPVFISSLMANDTFLRDWVISGEKEASSITKYLKEIKEKYGTVSSFFISEGTRKYYHAGGILKMVSEDEQRDEWYFRVREMVAPFEINVDPDMANNDEMTIFINYRVFDYDGNFIGVTGVGLTVNSVNSLLSDYENRFERHIYFVDDGGEIVLRPSNSPFLQNKSIEEIEGVADLRDSILKRTSAKLEYKRDGQLRFLNCRYVKELGWHLIVEQSEDVMLKPLKRQLRDNLILAVIITIVVAWICLAVINRYNGRLEKRNSELSRLLSENENQKRDIEKAANDQLEVNTLLSESNREKDEILSLVAHDLRNPLNGILGVCELATTDSKCEPCHEFFRTIDSSGKQMNSLIKNLLEASQNQPNNGRHLEDVQLMQLLEGLIPEFKAVAQRKNVVFEFVSENLDLPILKTHPDWATACINNVVGNAIKYTPHYGNVRIMTRVTETTVDFICKDSGPGIKEEDMDRLFQKFVRLSAKPTGGESSTGLGLYLVKRMCDKLEIEIGVESKLGHGTTFTLKFPL